MNARSRRFVQAGSLTLVAAFLLGAAEKPVIPWEELTPLDWLYSLATRFAVVDSHQVHYKTPTAELAGLLESRPEPEALRHLAQAQMDLGQRGKALATIEAWANKWAAAEPQASGGAWDDAARWAWSYGAHEEAFRFADHAIPALRGNPQTELANLRIQWAEEQQALRNRREMQRAALELNPTDWASAYRAVDADLTAENLDEAEEGLKHLPKNMPAEPALLLRTKLQIAKGQGESALPAMEAALDATPRHGRVFAPTYARAIDLGARNRPDEWRAALGARFDAAALTKLFTYFKGQERGDACLSLLQQMDRRYQKELDRAGWSLLSTLYSDVDAVPESFRARLAAATFGDAKANEADLAELARLALRAGGRPLAWGNYSDADYGWVARMDPTPGFWTGGLSLLLTGQDWKEALRRLEAESIPERTFGAARALLAELAKRNPGHESIPELKLEVMQRHVDRGEGAEALKLLAAIETSGPDAVRQSAQEIGLLAVRQTKAPLSSEIRLFKARLKYFAPDGSIPVSAPADALEGRFQKGDLLDWDQAMGDSMAYRTQHRAPR